MEKRNKPPRAWEKELLRPLPNDSYRLFQLAENDPRIDWLCDIEARGLIQVQWGKPGVENYMPAFVVPLTILDQLVKEAV